MHTTAATREERLRCVSRSIWRRLQLVGLDRRLSAMPSAAHDPTRLRTSCVTVAFAALSVIISACGGGSTPRVLSTPRVEVSGAEVLKHRLFRDDRLNLIKRI